MNNFTSFLIYFCVCFFSTISRGQETASLSALSKTVTVRHIDEEIESILYDLTKNYDIQFSYITKDIPLQAKRTAIVDNEPLQLLLELIFKETQIGFIALENQIILVKEDNLELIESKEQSGERIIYLPNLSPSQGKETPKINGISIDIYTLLDALRKLYMSQKTPIQLREQDSIFIDSVQLTALKKKQKKKWFDRISFENIPTSYGFTAGISGAFWFSQSRFDDKKYDINKVPDLGLDFGMDLILGDDIWVGTLGLRLEYLAKNGIHTNYYTNTIQPDSTFNASSGYQERYIHASLPLKLSYVIQRRKAKIFIGGGISIQRLITSDTEDSYRVYQTQFFTNLNQNSIANPDLSPYFDANFRPILSEPVSMRRWNFTGSLHCLWMLKLDSHWKFLVGPKIDYQFLSIYNTNAPITQTRLQAGLQLLITPGFVLD